MPRALNNKTFKCNMTASALIILIIYNLFSILFSIGVIYDKDTKFIEYIIIIIFGFAIMPIFLGILLKEITFSLKDVYITMKKYHEKDNNNNRNN